MVTGRRKRHMKELISKAVRIMLKMSFYPTRLKHTTVYVNNHHLNY